MNRQPIVLLALIAALTISAGCQSLYKSVVTITSLVDGASKSYATLYNNGLIPADTAAKVAKAHLAYREAAGVAEKALVAFKASDGTDKAAYDAAFAATLRAATEFINLIIPMLYADDSIALQTQLKKATAL